MKDAVKMTVSVTTDGPQTVEKAANHQRFMRGVHETSGCCTLGLRRSVRIVDAKK